MAGQEGVGLVVVGFGLGLVCPKALKRCEARGGQRGAVVPMPPWRDRGLASGYQEQSEDAGGVLGGPDPSAAWGRLLLRPGNPHFPGISSPSFMFQPLEPESFTPCPPPLQQEPILGCFSAKR